MPPGVPARDVRAHEPVLDLRVSAQPSPQRATDGPSDTRTHGGLGEHGGDGRQIDVGSPERRQTRLLFMLRGWTLPRPPS